MDNTVQENKQPRGRPAGMQEIDEMTVHKILAFLQLGMPVSEACEIAGLPRSTFYKHMTYDDFLRQKVQEARLSLKVGSGQKVYEIIFDDDKYDEDGKIIQKGKYSPEVRAAVAWKYYVKKYFEENQEDTEALLPVLPPMTNEQRREYNQRTGRSDRRVAEAIIARLKGEDIGA